MTNDRIKCLDSRIKRGLRQRRYLTEIGDEVVTVEIPIQVYRTMQARLSQRLEAYERNRDRLRLRHRIQSLLAQQWKPLAIAHELGISVSTVRRVYRQQNME